LNDTTAQAIKQEIATKLPKIIMQVNKEMQKDMIVSSAGKFQKIMKKKVH